ncbi:MAG: D-2-hydroxyacid dehydrogenase [Acidobacteriaceae bacterium]|nr:D-2-hydroxyacid dehydrogenase [Acidobacteriaceae bacterium]
MADDRLEILVITQDVPTVADRIGQACPAVRVHAAESAAALLDRAGQARAVMGLAQAITPEVVAAMPRLQWIQAFTTGIDPLLSLELPENVMITSARGIHGPQMSEMAFLHMLALARDLPRIVGNQQQQSWQRWPQRLLLGKTVVVAGIGAISEELARRCKAFGMHTVGISDARSSADSFDEIRPRRDLIASAAEADFLIVLTAYTPQTHHLINADVLDALRPDAFLINLARGPVVNEAALVGRLQSRRLGGAGLDVFDREPLAADSPLWRLDNVLITPHLGGMSDCYDEQLLPLVLDNLRAFAAGQYDQMHNRLSLAEIGVKA